MYWQDSIHEIPKQFVDTSLDEVKKQCGYIANHKAPKSVTQLTLRVYEMLKEGNKLVADLTLTRDDIGANEKTPEENT